MNKPLKIIISGGGSGGHIFPAIAIADALKRKSPSVEILFIGAKGKIEMEKVPLAGYPIEGLWISGFHRKEILRNLTFPFKLLSSLWKAHRIIRKFKPDVVVGVGGFASGPTLEVASRLKIPTLIQEQNAFPGITNRLLGKKVSKICAADESVGRFLPKEKIVLTGNPVRQDIVNPNLSRAEGIAHFGLDINKQTLFLFGGSLGAQSMNEALAANADLMRQHPDIQLLWQAGKLYIDQFSKTEMAQLPNVKILKFVDRMDLAYKAADVVIGRAGALTISELSMVGKAAILIPSPNVAEDHQTKNAQALEDKNAVVLLPDSKAKSDILKTAIELLKNENKRIELAHNIKNLAKPNAAESIASEVLKLTKSLYI